MELNKNHFELSQDGIVKYSSNAEFDCFKKLQSSQAQSADWAMKYEGWAVKEINPIFKTEWNEDDFNTVRISIVKYFAGKTYTIQHGEKMTFKRTFKQMESQFGFAYTSSSSYAMFGICNISPELNQGGKVWHYNHIALSENGYVFAILHDYDENELFIQMP